MASTHCSAGQDQAAQKRGKKIHDSREMKDYRARTGMESENKDLYLPSD